MHAIMVYFMDNMLFVTP